MNSKPAASFLPPLWVITLALCAAVAWVLSELREIVVLVVVGYCIAYVMDPVLRVLERRKVSRPLGVFIVAGTVGAVFLLLLLTALPTLMREFQQLSQNFPTYVQTARDRLLPILNENIERFHLRERLPSPDEMIANVAGFGGTIVQTAGRGIMATLLHGYSITMTILNLFLLPFIVFYLAVDFAALHRWALAAVPPPYRERVRTIASEINAYVGAFVRGQFLTCSLLCVLYAFGLGVVGVELWLLLAVLTGFGNLIPYVGTLVGIVLSSIMALVTFGSIGALIQVWVVFAIVQFLEGMVITPKIVGEKVGLAPLSVILALVAGGTLFGLLGIFLAVPAAASLKVIGRHARRSFFEVEQPC